MPIYVYQCDDCGEYFEKLVSISASDKKQECVKCASVNTRKQLAAVNIIGSSKPVKSSCGGCHSNNCSSCH
jgi:putative FmdB family regulatory protein